MNLVMFAGLVHAIGAILLGVHMLTAPASEPTYGYSSQVRQNPSVIDHMPQSTKLSSPTLSSSPSPASPLQGSDIHAISEEEARKLQLKSKEDIEQHDKLQLPAEVLPELQRHREECSETHNRNRRLRKSHMKRRLRQQQHREDHYQNRLRLARIRRRRMREIQMQRQEEQHQRRLEQQRRLEEQRIHDQTHSHAYNPHNPHQLAGKHVNDYVHDHSHAYAHADAHTNADDHDQEILYARARAQKIAEAVRHANIRAHSHQYQPQHQHQHQHRHRHHSHAHSHQGEPKHTHRGEHRESEGHQHEDQAPESPPAQSSSVSKDEHSVSAEQVAGLRQEEKHEVEEPGKRLSDETSGELPHVPDESHRRVGRRHHRRLHAEPTGRHPQNAFRLRRRPLDSTAKPALDTVE